MIRLYRKEIRGIWFAVALKNEEVVATAFSSSAEEKVLQRLLKNLPYNVPFKLEEETNSFSERILTVLRHVYDGKDQTQDFNLAKEYLSNYAQRVLELVKRIPTGYVTSYGAISKVVGGSPRSVGRVLASNPFVLLVPCHRVVSSDMSLGGYGYGLDVKWEILQHEERGYEQPLKLSVEDKFLTIFPVKFVRSEGSKRKN